MKLFKDTLVVVVPVAIGIWLKHLVPRAVKKIEPAAPLVSVIVIVLIVAAIIEVRAADIKEHWRTLLLTVCMLHGLAFALGYGLRAIVRLCETHPPHCVHRGGRAE